MGYTKMKQIKIEMLENDLVELESLLAKQADFTTVINNDDRTFHIVTNLDIPEVKESINKCVLKWLGKKIDFSPEMLYNVVKMTNCDYLLII